MAAEVEEMKKAYEEKLKEVNERAKTASESRKTSSEEGARVTPRGEVVVEAAGKAPSTSATNGEVVQENHVNQEQLKAMEK